MFEMISKMKRGCMLLSRQFGNIQSEWTSMSKSMSLTC